MNCCELLLQIVANCSKFLMHWIYSKLKSSRRREGCVDDNEYKEKEQVKIIINEIFSNCIPTSTLVAVKPGQGAGMISFHVGAHQRG